MSGPTTKLSPEDVAEIERHKYFLSEKAGYDVGWEFAEQDWKSNHADQFGDSTDPESKAQTGGIGTFLRRLLAK